MYSVIGFSLIVLGSLVLVWTGVSVHLYKRVRDLEKIVGKLSMETKTIEKTVSMKPVLRVGDSRGMSREEFEREIMLLHFKGYSIRQIAKSVGKSKSFVHKVIKNNKSVSSEKTVKKKKKQAVSVSS